MTETNSAPAQVKVSIIVPTFNRRSSLRRLLESLDLQTYPHAQFEVIVIDDGSPDGTVAFAREWDASFRLRVIEQEHGGPAAARNRGVTEASGALILFLDDDVVPIPELIEVHMAAHAAEPNAVVVGPMSPPADWARPAWVRWEEEKLLAEYRNLMDGAWPCSGRQFYTGNASLSRARFLEAGGFDTTFLRAEDVELGYRLEARGARFVFDPRADVLHYAWRTFASWCRSPYQYGRYDVVMQRDKGQPTLDNATREFHGRHALNRLVLHLFAGRRALVDRLLVPLLGALVGLAGPMGARRISSSALSAIFSLLYWQGVCDELGDRGAMWRSIAAARPLWSGR